MGGITGRDRERDAVFLVAFFKEKKKLPGGKKEGKGRSRGRGTWREFEGKLSNRGGICQEKLLVALGIFIRRWRAR